MLNLLKRLFARRPDPAQTTLDEGETLRQTRRAFVGELPITRETLWGKEVLTIEPTQATRSWLGRQPAADPQCGNPMERGR